MVLGITASIACGKSIVIEYIKKKGYDVISLDDISHEIFDTFDVNELIKESFDIKKEGLVTREEIANIVFTNIELREELNKILHPLILNKMNEYINKAKEDKKDIFIEVPLLYEVKMRDCFDKVILVYASRDKQIERLMERNDLSYEDAIKRIDSQLDIEKKKELALENNDFLIDNNQDLDYTYKAIDKMLDTLRG